MTYRGLNFNSLAEYNAVLDQNQGWRVVSACPGNISGSIFATFDIPAEKEEAVVAEKGSHKPDKYPAEAEEEDDQMVEEEEVKEKPEKEEEKPEKPRRAVPRHPVAPSFRKAATVIKQHHLKKKGK